jgi:hypothetical protein
MHRPGANRRGRRLSRTCNGCGVEVRRAAGSAAGSGAVPEGVRLPHSQATVSLAPHGARASGHGVEDGVPRPGAGNNDAPEAVEEDEVSALEEDALPFFKDAVSSTKI